MQLVKLSNITLRAVYSCLGDINLDNLETCKKLYGDSAENVIKGTGFKYRNVVSPGVSSLDLCCQAAEQMLNDTHTNREDIGAVICVTFTPEYLMPCNACGAQARLNLSKDVLAFDIGLACSGYAYGFYIAGMLANQLKKKVLLLDGDIQTAYLSHQDKATEPVMGDAGSATLIDYSPDDNWEWAFTFLTDGSLREILYMPAGGSKKPVTEEDLELKSYEDGSKRRNCDIYMDGFGVFKFVASQATNLIMNFMKEINIDPDSLDAFVPHQANIYMVKQMAKRLKIAPEKVWISGDVFGNSSSATVPVTLSYEGKKNTKKKGKMIFSGFGGGMSVSVGFGYIPDTCQFKCSTYNKQ